MNISKWTHAGTIVKMNALNYPDKLGWQDKAREFTFKEWNERSCRFANGLTAMGVGQKDSFAVLAYNRGEWMDIYAGCAKGGQMVVPIMFRLAAPDIQYIAEHSECKAIVVEAPFVEMVDGIRGNLQIPEGNFIYL
ncbi:MAG TPA: AMP-binding protein, partial [Deltaproteobacteria bacterium]|nr:AMP-binding protein [Deltaproteobacteria bacterium]